MEALIAIVVIVAVALFVAVPLRRAAGATAPDEVAVELADLEARKEAKYRQIRDAAADRAAGKLSESDFERIDAELRREAIEILRRIDKLNERQLGAADRGPG